MDAIKALKDIRDITMNRLTPIHKEIYDIADAALREASAEEEMTEFEALQEFDAGIDPYPGTRAYRPTPAQGEKKHEEGYTGMRVELVNHGGEDKFEIILHKGDGIRVLSVEKAEQLANWIHELLDVQSAAGS
jgi:hypothetical protein